MKKSFIIIICTGITVMAAHAIIKHKKNAETLVKADIEVLSSCEATYPNSKGQIVTIKCKGEQGACQIKREDKVSTPYGKFTVYVDATCSGVKVSQ